MFEYTVFCLFVVLYVAKSDSKVCSREKVVHNLQIVSYLHTYTETRNEICTTNNMDSYEYEYNYDYYDEKKKTYKCLKSVTKTKMMTRYLPHVENKTEYFCCPGYSRIDNLNSNNTNEEDINCEPICDPPCQNGLCEAPQKCRCSPGYIPNLDLSNPCLPVCDLDCGYGTCDKPNTCVCFTGYELTRTTSHAVCTEIQHKFNECISGYIKSDIGTCKPKCSNGCIHGICTSPEVCQCNPGFHLETNKTDGSKVCIPDCDPGYKNIGGLCYPECHHSCGNGTCILPNVCECFRGYKIDITKFSSQAASDGFLCIPSCKYCVGECVAPNTCITSTMTTPSSNYISKLSNPTKSQFYKSMKYATVLWSSTFQSTTTSLTTPRSATWSISPPATTLSTSSRLTSWTTSPWQTRLTSPMSTTWSTTPRSTTTWSTTSWSTTPGSPSRPTTQQHTEVNQTVTAKVRSSTKTARPVKSNHLESAQSRGEKTWVEQHWASVMLPVLLLLFAVLVMLIVWRRKPIIIYLRGRSYVVEDHVTNGYNFDEPVHYSKRNQNVECK